MICIQSFCFKQRCSYDEFSHGQGVPHHSHLISARRGLATATREELATVEPATATDPAVADGLSATGPLLLVGLFKDLIGSSYCSPSSPDPPRSAWIRFQFSVFVFRFRTSNTNVPHPLRITSPHERTTVSPLIMVINHRC